MLAAGGYQHIRMFDLTSGNLNPVVNYEGISKNIMTVGFQADLNLQVGTGKFHRFVLSVGPFHS